MFKFLPHDRVYRKLCRWEHESLMFVLEVSDDGRAVNVRYESDGREPERGPLMRAKDLALFERPKK